MTVAPLHLRIARVWARAIRVRRASVAAVAASLVGWTAGAPAGTHALAIAVSALVAAAWPVRSRDRAALAWVGDHVGLAYETALEVDEGHDPYGLRHAVAVQGRLVIRDLKPPTPPAWWVPALLLAATLWVWGAWVGVPWTTPWTAPGAPATTPTTPPGGDGGPVAAPVEVTAPDRATPESLPAAEPGGDGDALGEGGSAGGGGGAGGAPSERNALERFAQNLRERETQPAGAVGGAEDAGGGEEGDAEGEGETEVTAPRSPDPGGEGETTGEGEPGDEGGSEGDEAGREGPTEQEGDQAGGEGGGPQDGDAAPQDEAAQNDQAPTGGDAAGAGLDEGEDGGDAGVGAGVAGETGPEVGAADARAPEALPSIVGPGPETEVGAVSLPGTSEGAFPAGAAAAEYRRAVEVALTEGEVPVPYQEVIRNYFR